MRNFLLNQSWYLALRKIWVGYKLLYRQDSYLNTTGYVRSHQKIASVGPDDLPVPWMNYPVVEFLNARLNKSVRVFEYGSGYSTRFYAERAAEVTALEHEQQWVDEVRSKLQGLANTHLIFRPNDDSYPKAILDQDGFFDLVVVDGRQRVACARVAFEKLSPAGVVLLDDSYRDKYQGAFDFYREKGFRELEFSGIMPLGFTRVTSTLFYRSNNCLGI